MDIISIVALIFIIGIVVYKVRGFIQGFFPEKVPEWHNKHGEEYIKYKNDLNKS